MERVDILTQLKLLLTMSPEITMNRIRIEGGCEACFISFACTSVYWHDVRINQVRECRRRMIHDT